METTHTKTPILIVGAMGHLGCHVTRCALQEPTLLVNITDCDLTKDTELVKMVEKSGGKVCKSDICDPKTLKECTKGMHTVISVVSSDDVKTMVEGQINLMKVCAENGVQRFVPSEFGINIDRLTKEELSGCPIMKCKKELVDCITSGTITTPKILRIETGMMMETCCELMKTIGVGCYGDKTLKHDLTCYEDVGKLIVSAISKKDTTGTLGLVGCTMTMDEIVTTYNKVRGTKLECKRLGSLEDLKKKCEDMRKTGNMKEAEMCSLLSIMMDPRSKLEKTHNTMIPTVKTTTMEDFLRTHPEITLE